MDSVIEWEMQFMEKYDHIGRLLKPGEKHCNYKAEESEDESSRQQDKTCNKKVDWFINNQYKKYNTSGHNLKKTVSWCANPHIILKIKNNTEVIEFIEEKNENTIIWYFYWLRMRANGRAGVIVTNGGNTLVW